MLKKIIVVRNVGRFVNSALPPLPMCAKYTLIFGANGYGKTTLSAILRSLGTNDTGLIAGRTRVGATAAPQVELLLDSGTAKFEDGTWSVAAPEVIVFDSSFIAENVHSGDAVDLQQKRNLYRVIVGKEGIDLAVEEEQLAGTSREVNTQIKTAEKAIQSHVPHGMKIEDFIKLPADAEIDPKITSQTKTLSAVQEAGQLKARPALVEATFPALPTGFEALLGKTLDGVAEDAQKRITEHIKHHDMDGQGEAWIADGVDHISDDSCPFCGQPVKGLALIEAFRRVFGEAYRDMKTSVEQMRAVVERDFGDRAVGSLETLLETNRSGAEFWSRYSKLPELHVPTEAHQAMSMLKVASVNLLARKSAAPQDAVALDPRFVDAVEHYQAMRTTVDSYNATIKASNMEIGTKKAAVASGDINKEEAALARLNAQKNRHDPKVAPLCTEHQTLVKDKEMLDAKKAVVRSKFEEYTRKVIKPYEARINELLDNFNAGFRIAETKPSYAGGVASSTYQLVINNTGIELGDSNTPLDRPSFKNTLSAGDRNTLALAFFLAHLERDPDRAQRIVVFDDPFTSQDSFRHRQTIYEIKKAGAACEQVIVMSHDATFLRRVRDKCPAADTVALQLADHRSMGIKITVCDLDEACRGRAASEMDDLQAYSVTGAGKDRDIIKKMRVVLETYCRSTYPSSFEPNDLLGGMVVKIKKVGDQHPAWPVMDELEQINDYSRDHHHGEDSQDGNADLIDPAELAGFVKRTLRLVNNLQA